MERGQTGTRTRARTPRAAGELTAILTVTAVCWIVAIREMVGMTAAIPMETGSFIAFLALWVTMMAAMMLPGSAPAVLRRADAGRYVLAVPFFIMS